MGWQGWVSIVALLLAAGALAVAVQVHRHARRRGAGLFAPALGPSSAGGSTSGTGSGPVAFVVNPSKPGAAALRDAALLACAARYLPEPMFFETTVEDPGVGQTRRALEEGASVVVAAGGDGTVRAVAEALLGSDVPMGIVPLGTGNLFARNLDIPLTRLDEQLRIALTASPRPVDVGWVRLGAPRRDEDYERGEEHGASDGPGKGHLFLVIAGIGFDAAMVESADDELKARVGWIAYFLAGAKHLNGRRMRLQVQLDRRSPVTVRARSLLIGNCGKLPGGLTLLPGAEVDDGWLDIAAIDTRGGIAGWAQLFGEVVLQGVGLRNELPKLGRIDHARTHQLRIVSDRPVSLQIDGEPLGRAVSLRAEVQHHALAVRAP
ncbi:MAG: diacylglycerol kinase [Actinomycetales bacterium]|nr:diacylglycerol kinase [Actinomycetales bacterium]